MFDILWRYKRRLKIIVRLLKNVQIAKPVGLADEPCRPVLRWAGGKHGMAPILASLLPNTWGTYLEPMAGGAALFFFVQPPRAVLSDVNGELMNFYSVLRDQFPVLRRRLMKLSASEGAYYAFRESTPRGSIQRAVRFAYLNRLAWNGLYRVNRAGKFNVPIGDRLPEDMWSMTDLERASTTLMAAKLKTGDFRTITEYTMKGDFVFLIRRILEVPRIKSVLTDMHQTFFPLKITKI